MTNDETKRNRRDTYNISRFGTIFIYNFRCLTSFFSLLLLSHRFVCRSLSVWCLTWIRKLHKSNGIWWCCRQYMFDVAIDVDHNRRCCRCDRCSVTERFRWWPIEWQKKQTRIGSLNSCLCQLARSLSNRFALTAFNISFSCSFRLLAFRAYRDDYYAALCLIISHFD